MLTPMDDTLWHQLPTTFDHVGTSDPRFYDRYWFAVYDPAGAAALQITMGVYPNMNVVDAGFVVVHGTRQHNLRASRSLRPRFETVCGPVRIEVVEPLERFRLVVAPGDHAVHGELEWAGVLRAEQEQPHFSRVRGRVNQEYQRFDQLGTCSGWLDVAGTRIDVDDWWACRDHSWGVRPGMGVPEPVTGPARPLSDVGGFTTFFLFSTGELAGHLQVMERGTERTYLSGHVVDRRRPDAAAVAIVGAAIELELHPGTRRFRTVTIDADLDAGLVDAEGGRSLHVTADALGPAIAMAGLGYSGGFDDGRGLGAWRGDEHVESETWDVSDPAVVGLADGTTTTPWHRIQPVRVAVSGGPGSPGGGTATGTGSLTMAARGRLPQYGL